MDELLDWLLDELLEELLDELLELLLGGGVALGVLGGVVGLLALGQPAKTRQAAVTAAHRRARSSAAATGRDESLNIIGSQDPLGIDRLAQGQLWAKPCTAQFAH